MPNYILILLSLITFGSLANNLDSTHWKGDSSTSRITSLDGSVQASLFASNGNPHIGFVSNLKECEGEKASFTIAESRPISINKTKTTMNEAVHQLVNFSISCMGKGYGNGSMAFFLTSSEAGKDYLNDAFNTSIYVSFGTTVFSTHNFTNEYNKLSQSTAL